MDVDVPKVLVLDANQRSALAVTRSLGRSGRYHVSTADSGTASLAGASRFSQRYFQYPDPSAQPLAFIGWFRDFLARHPFDLVMPTTEVTSQLLLAHKSELGDLNLPFAPYAQVMELADKISLVKLAQKLDLAVPDSHAYESLEEVAEDDLRFPVVIKPAVSRIFREDHWVHTQVHVAHDLAGWHQAVAQSPYLQDSPFMLQEFIPGHGRGLFCLYNGGEPLQFFAHERLREKPPEGGVSVLSRSVPVDPKLKATAQKLLEAVNWHGVAMVEFRVTDTGQPYLMEINTRFWGSLQLAIDAGVDFPMMLARVQLGEPVTGDVQYPADQRLRWLLGDLDSLYLYFKGRRPLVQKMKRLLQFLSIRLRNQRQEVNRLNDLKPAWLELRQYLRALVK